MMEWSGRKPTQSEMLDHDVPIVGEHLKGKRIALLISGGIAAMKAPFLARALRRHGARVTAYLSDEGARYVAVDALEWAAENPVVRDLSPRAEHLERADPFAAYLVAPATYNTINKMWNGTADGVLSTTLATAIGLLEQGKTRVIVAPTMHGDMHNAILEASYRGLKAIGVDFIDPRDAYGKHNIPEPSDIAAFVCAALSSSPLKGRKVLVTAGSAPVKIDGARIITNIFRGRLGVEIATELALRGADVRLVLGKGAIEPPRYLRTAWIGDYNEYRDVVLDTLEKERAEVGFFAAAVADYRPATVFEGKIPSGGALKSIELAPTEKVIDLVLERFPDLKMVSFKFEAGIELDALFAKCRSRTERGHFAVLANRAEDMPQAGAHRAYLCRQGSEPEAIDGKTAIARRLCDAVAY